MKRSELEVFNLFRTSLDFSEVKILQLVPPGGQAPLSITFKSHSTSRHSTVFPDLIASNSKNIFIGELKPRYSKADYLKLEKLRLSPDAYSVLRDTVQRSEKQTNSLERRIIPLLIHMQSEIPIIEDVLQLIMNYDGTFKIAKKDQLFVFPKNSRFESIAGV